MPEDQICSDLPLAFKLDFVLGDLPAIFDHFIIRQPRLLGGIWKEESKPFAECVAFLERLGFTPVKRRIAARSHCNMEIEIPLKSGSNIDDEVENAKSSTEGPVPSTAATTPKTSAPPSQPVSPLGQRRDDSPPEHYRWLVRQYFALGKEKSIEFISDGTAIEVDDLDTGHWTVASIYCDGKLIQRRHSESLGLTMYDTRCVMRKKVPLLENEVGTSPDDSHAEDGGGVLWQLFQWKIIDHRKNDHVSTCMYYLRSVS